MNTNNSERHAYFVGGGLASLSGAIYLVEDGGFKGENIHIIEALPILGGSNDGAGTKEKGFICRAGFQRILRHIRCRVPSAIIWAGLR